MEKLLSSYAGNSEAIEKITDARKAVVDLYIATARYAVESNVKGKDADMPISEIEAARNAVNTLNAMCLKKGIEPVYTADDTNLPSLFQYAREFTTKIYQNAISGN